MDSAKRCCDPAESSEGCCLTFGVLGSCRSDSFELIESIGSSGNGRESEEPVVELEFGMSEGAAEDEDIELVS
jgi:hypothetical protein